MSWTMIGKPQTQKVTHALAQRFAEMEPAPGDRLLKEWRVKWLVKQVHDGTFRTCEWAAAWGYWNLFYYPHLGQWLSAAGGLAIVVANSIWFGQLVYYSRWPVVAGCDPLK